MFEKTISLLGLLDDGPVPVGENLSGKCDAQEDDGLRSSGRVAD